MESNVPLDGPDEENGPRAIAISLVQLPGRRLVSPRLTARTFSHLWQGRIVNEGMPQVDGVAGDCATFDPGVLASQGRELILITRNDAEAETARNNLLKRGIRTECTANRSFQVDEEKSLQVFVCRLAPDRRR